MNNKIWTIKGKEELYTDEELIELIKKGVVSKSEYIATKDMKHHIKVADSIYSFYVKEKKQK